MELLAAHGITDKHASALVRKDWLQRLVRVTYMLPDGHAMNAAYDATVRLLLDKLVQSARCNSRLGPSGSIHHRGPSSGGHTKATLLRC
jgi:hypothetical protein